MANLKKMEAETVATIDTAKAMIDKVLTIMEIMVNMPSLSATFSVSPMEFLLKLLEHAGVTYEDLKLWLTDFLIYTLPALEVGVKAVLLTNLKNMVSCSIDPRIPEKYRKLHKEITNINTPNEYGIDIDIESIDFLDKLSVSPLSDFGRDMYFGQNGVDDVYKFARADDFDAFLWFVMHKGKFPNPSNVDVDGATFGDDVHGLGKYTVSPENGTLLQELKINPSEIQSSSILPGNTFKYATKSPGVLSMCIDATRNSSGDIVSNTIVPVSDDLTSVNWYIRRKDQLGDNIIGSYAAGKPEKTYVKGKYKTTGVKTKNKSRDYSKEKAICNLQYIDNSSAGSRISGLASNKFRFTILPKPYIHIPSVADGEPVWRFKKLLFDANGNYDPNGKYTIPLTATEGSKIDDYIPVTIGSATIKINVKSGNVEVEDTKKLIPNLIECYPGLTVYEFNYDYVMGMKLFDAKVMASTLLQTLVNTKLGINLTLAQKQQEAQERIVSIVKNIVNTDESESNECYFSFDNAKYDDLLKRAEQKRAKRQAFGNVTRDAGVFTDVNKILEEYDSATELHEKKEILSRAIDRAAATVSEGSDGEDKYNVQFSFVLDLIENLVMALINAVMSPKVLMLLEVNERLMGGSWKKFTVEDLLKAMMNIINALVKEVRDLLIQELLKLLMKYLHPIIELMGSIIVREKLDAYAELIDNIIKNCPLIWFRFGNQDLETKLDTVDYADIDVSSTRAGDKPSTNNC